MLLVAATAAFVLAMHQGREPLFFEPDKVEHATWAYGITLAMTIAFPGIRLRWLVVVLLGAGALVEVLQSFPFVAADAEFTDWIADSVGVSLAILPMFVRRQAGA